MSEIVFDNQSVPVTPAAGQLAIWSDSVSRQLTGRDEFGATRTLAGIRRFAAANVVANAADTYLVGLPVPSHLLQAGANIRIRMVMTKTAAGVAAPVWNLRVGTAGTVADAARLTFTGPIQTAVIDTAIVELYAVLRNGGSVAVLSGGLQLFHNLALTGFATLGTPVLQAISAAFDATVPNLIVGLSVNPGAAGVWTHTVVEAEMVGT